MFEFFKLFFTKKNVVFVERVTHKTSTDPVIITFARVNDNMEIIRQPVYSNVHLWYRMDFFEELHHYISKSKKRQAKKIRDIHYWLNGYCSNSQTYRKLDFLTCRDVDDMIYKHIKLACLCERKLTEFGVKFVAIKFSCY